MSSAIENAERIGRRMHEEAYELAARALRLRHIARDMTSHPLAELLFEEIEKVERIFIRLHDLREDGRELIQEIADLERERRKLAECLDKVTRHAPEVAD